MSVKMLVGDGFIESGRIFFFFGCSTLRWILMVAPRFGPPGYISPVKVPPIDFIHITAYI